MIILEFNCESSRISDANSMYNGKTGSTLLIVENKLLYYYNYIYIYFTITVNIKI